MHENAMWAVLRGLRPGLTVHGFRSTFNDWAAEHTGLPPRHVLEMALAHSHRPHAVEAAYRRGDLSREASPSSWLIGRTSAAPRRQRLATWCRCRGGARANPG